MTWPSTHTAVTDKVQHLLFIVKEHLSITPQVVHIKKSLYIGGGHLAIYFQIEF